MAEPFHGEWKHRPVLMVQAFMVLLVIPIAIGLVHLAWFWGEPDRLLDIVLVLFMIGALCYLIAWCQVEMVRNARGMVWHISKRTYVSAVDSIRDALDRDGVVYDGVEGRLLYFILSMPRYTFTLGDVRIQVLAPTTAFERGAIVDVGPVTEDNGDEVRRLINLVDL